MIVDLFGIAEIGPPQLAACLILLQRGFEEIHSTRNTRRLLDKGAQEFGREYYPVVAVSHLAWIAALFLLVPAAADVIWPLLWVYLLVQILRYWVIGTLGRYWTHRILSLNSDPVVATGPYKFLRHPNYLVTMIETPLLPLCFGAIEVAVVMSPIWAAVLYYKIILEDHALSERRSG
jgi:methyltransferase